MRACVRLCAYAPVRPCPPCAHVLVSACASVYVGRGARSAQVMVYHASPRAGCLLTLPRWHTRHPHRARIRPYLSRIGPALSKIGPHRTKSRGAWIRRSVTCSCACTRIRTRKYARKHARTHARKHACAALMHTRTCMHLHTLACTHVRLHGKVLRMLTTARPKQRWSPPSMP